VKKKKLKKKPLRVVADPVGIDAVELTPELSPETHAALAAAMVAGAQGPLAWQQDRVEVYDDLPARVAPARADELLASAKQERERAEHQLKRTASEALEDAVEEADLDGFVAIEAADRDGHDVEDTALVALLQDAPSDAPEAPAATQALLKGYAVQVAPPSNGNGHATYLDEPSDLAALLPSRR